MQRRRQKQSRRRNQTRRQPARQKLATTSSKSSIGKALVNAGAGVANNFVPGAGALVKGLGRLMGFGAYTREGAEKYLASKVPSMHATLDQGVRIAHHEYLGEMSSSILFSLLSYPINPGLSGTFPWLSTIASAFQKWEDHGIVFYFKSTSANALNSVNTALGSVMGAVTYNPYQLAPADKITMLALSGVSTGKPAEDNLYPVECKSSQSLFGTKLVRVGKAVDDLAKYDAGNFHIATVGSQAAAIIGELHVVYDITLKEPKLSPGGWVYHATSSTYSNDQVVSAINLTVQADPFGIKIENPSAVTTKITFPKHMGSKGSIFALNLEWYGGNTAVIAYPAIAFTNADWNPLLDAPYNAGYAFIPITGATSARASYNLYFKTLDWNQDVTITLTGGAPTVLPAAPTIAHVFIHECDYYIK